ncbi:PilN domain-containing protein [Methylomonas koyamae]|uniref:PilN domain-containing protein n=1 Tax=Methylomonas koyamae TaxID=702114 RepID=UPI001C3410F5|nr:PilN domain-containing protein [Methylomonas koyamae]BBL58695.1 general secretion pathway protein GspL [Methylomonas koyamae]
MSSQTTIDFDPKRFWQWWSGELAFLLPPGLKRLLSDRSGVALFRPDANGFRIEFHRESAAEDAAVWQLDANAADAYRNLKHLNPELDKAECLLRLNPGQALQKRLFLPAAAQENLQQVVGFELDRYTPFSADQVYYAAIVLGKTEFGQIEVLLVLTPKPLLDDYLARLQALGVQATAVDFGQAETVCPARVPRYTLLPEQYRPRPNNWVRAVHWSLNALLLLLLASVLVWPVWQEGEAVDALKRQLKTLEKETTLIEAQQSEIDALRGQTQRLIGIKSDAPSLVAVLNELSVLLKDDTWLTHFQYAEKRLQIQGQSPAASSLIGVLEASPFFSNVSFVSPLTQDKATGRERFQISMDVAAVQPGQAEGDAATPAAASDDSVGENPNE